MTRRLSEKAPYDQQVAKAEGYGAMMQAMPPNLGGENAVMSVAAYLRREYPGMVTAECVARIALKMPDPAELQQ